MILAALGSRSWAIRVQAHVAGNRRTRRIAVVVRRANRLIVGCPGPARLRCDQVGDAVMYRWPFRLVIGLHVQGLASSTG